MIVVRLFSGSVFTMFVLVIIIVVPFILFLVFHVLGSLREIALACPLFLCFFYACVDFRDRLVMYGVMYICCCLCWL